MFWTPAEQSRGAHGFWWNSDRLKLVELAGLAAQLWYSHFNRLTWCEADNDRDHIKW